MLLPPPSPRLRRQRRDRCTVSILDSWILFVHFTALGRRTNTWCYQQPGGPHVSSSSAPLLRPQQTRTTRHAPRPRRTSCWHSSTARHPCARLPASTACLGTCSPRRHNAPRATRQEQRAKSNAPRASHEDRKPPVRQHGPDSPDRHQRGPAPRRIAAPASSATSACWRMWLCSEHA